MYHCPNRHSYCLLLVVLLEDFLYIFTSVCQEFCSRGGGGAVAWSRGGSGPRGVPGPGGKGVPGPGGCLLGGSGPGGVTGPEGCLLGVVYSGGAWWRHPPGTATAVGGTHPTGIHSFSMLC